MHSRLLMFLPRLSLFTDEVADSATSFSILPVPSQAKHRTPPVPRHDVQTSFSFVNPFARVVATAPTMAPPMRTSCMRDGSVAWHCVLLVWGCDGLCRPRDTFVVWIDVIGDRADGGYVYFLRKWVVSKKGSIDPIMKKYYHTFAKMIDRVTISRLIVG